MSGSLPEMENWDEVFDETYLRTYAPFIDEEQTRDEALASVALAGVCDWARGMVATRHLIVGNGDPVERRFVLNAYTVTEWVAMARESGFEQVECFADWAATSPPTPEARLIVRAR